MSYDYVSGLGAASFRASLSNRTPPASSSSTPQTPGFPGTKSPGKTLGTGTKNVLDARFKASQKKKQALDAAARIRDLKEKRAAAAALLDRKKATEPKDPSTAALQKKVDDLTKALAQAQKDQASSAKAAADQHKQEVEALQKQINDLMAALQSAQSSAAGGGGGGGGGGASEQEVATLENAAAALQEQQAVAQAEAQVEEQAAAETAAEAQQTEAALPWHTKYKTWLYVGGAAVILGAGYYYFMRPKTAMSLPVPTSPKSPSGLAANASRSREYAGGDKGFQKWLDEVDRIVSSKIGLSLFDLEDMNLWDSYYSGDTPEQCVREVVMESIRDNYGDEYAALLKNKKGRGRR
jgi:hypothetical protein